MSHVCETCGITFELTVTARDLGLDTEHDKTYCNPCGQRLPSKYLPTPADHLVAGLTRTFGVHPPSCAARYGTSGFWKQTGYGETEDGQPAYDIVACEYCGWYGYQVYDLAPVDDEA